MRAFAPGKPDPDKFVGKREHCQFHDPKPAWYEAASRASTHGAAFTARRGKAMRRGVLVVMALCLAVAACSRKEPVRFDGLQFRTQAAASREDARDFTVSVREAGTNIAAAQRAGRYQAVQHCISAFSGSDIAWGPAALAPPEELTLEADGTLLLQGRCLYR